MSTKVIFPTLILFETTLFFILFLKKISLGSLKNKSAIYRLLSANLISGFTQGLNMIAIPWYFIDIAEAGSIYGVLFAAITFVTLFWTLYAGTLVDRFPRKNIFLSINICGFIFLVSTGIFGIVNEGLPLWMVGSVFMFSIFVFNIHYPSVYAFSQEVVEPEYYGRVNSMIEVQGQSASMIAGALAAFLLGGTSGKLKWFEDLTGIIVEPWGIYEIFLLDGITYFLAFLIILSIRYTPLKERIYKKENLIKRFTVGLQFLRNNRAIMWFGLLSFSVFVVTIVEGFYLAAIYVSDYLKEDAVIYTIIEIAYAFGAIVSGIFVRKIFKRFHPITSIIIIMSVIMIGFIICGFSKSNFIFILFNFVLGLSNSGVRILRITLLFNLIPNEIIGRINGLFASYQTLMRGLFILLFSIPFFLEADQIRYAYYIFGLFLLVSIILMMTLTKSLWKEKYKN